MDIIYGIFPARFNSQRLPGNPSLEGFNPKTSMGWMAFSMGFWITKETIVDRLLAELKLAAPSCLPLI